MPKDTKSLGNNKAPACESRGFVLKKKKVRILTHLLYILKYKVLFYVIFVHPLNKIIYQMMKIRRPVFSLFHGYV